MDIQEMVAQRLWRQQFMREWHCTPEQFTAEVEGDNSKVLEAKKAYDDGNVKIFKCHNFYCVERADYPKYLEKHETPIPGLVRLTWSVKVYDPKGYFVGWVLIRYMTWDPKKGQYVLIGEEY